MKKILLLSDFSKRNRYAELTALNLCIQLQLDLLVMNNYDSIPLVPFVNQGASTSPPSGLYDETREEMLTKVKQIKEELSKMPDGGYVPTIRSVITEGDIGIQVSNIVPREDIEIVVMGAGKGSSFAHLLLGNVLRSVINNSACPVLVISESVPQKKLDKVIFTTDFHSEDVNALNYLIRLSERLGFSIEVVHVYRPSTGKPEQAEWELEFIKKLQDFHHVNISYTHLVGEDLIAQINELCKQAGQNWLSMADYKRSTLLTVFHQSTIVKAIRNPHLPILIFPKQMLPAKYFLKYLT